MHISYLTAINDETDASIQERVKDSDSHLISNSGP